MKVVGSPRMYRGAIKGLNPKSLRDQNEQFMMVFISNETIDFFRWR